MLTEIKNYDLRRSLIVQTAAAFFLVFWIFAATANTQTLGQNMTPPASNDTKTAETKPVIVLQPVLTNYKEITIGTPAAEVRHKLGKAKIDDKDGFYYQISDEEFAQIRIDKDKKVRLISVTYTDKSKNPPQYADVFGTDATAPAKPDGSIYNIVRYPQAGYWVAYSRTAGEKPSVTITMQKMRALK